MKPVSRIITGIFLLFAAESLLAQGRIEGHIITADSDASLQGARVSIPALNRITPSGPDGRFIFGNVAPGRYDVRVDYLGLPTESRQVVVEEGVISTVMFEMGQDMEEVLVRGMRAATMSAMNMQRNSDRVVAVVTSDDIGQLPDANVAEALQRVPGVFLERDQGEGRFVGIRGIDPNLNVTTINGLLVPAPESGARSVALDVIPSDLSLIHI